MYPTLFRRALFPAYETLTGRGTHRFLAEYGRNQWLDRADVERLQLGKLNDLLDFCWREVPYLQRRWRAAGLEPHRLGSLRDLEAFPALTKAEISANYRDMTAVPWRGRSLSKTTGGTTGDPFRFEYSMESYARRTAVMWRAYEWAGAGPGVRTAYLWAVPPMRGGWRGLKERAYQRAFNRRFFDAFAMTQDNLAGYARALAAYRPRVLVAYVRPVLELARWANRSGHRLPRLASVVTGAEALFEAERTEIQQAFGCPVFNTYGSREFMLIAAECERHAGLHVAADHLVVETVDGAGRAVPSGPGEVLVTDLHNRAMPLVRYRNGDSATVGDGGACGCGRGLPLLESVDGRILDLITTPDGRQVPGEFFVHRMLGRTFVRQYQVVQVEPDLLEVRIVADRGLRQEDGDRIAASFSEAIGSSMRIAVTAVDAIDETASGKRRVTVSLESHRARSRTG